MEKITIESTPPDQETINGSYALLGYSKNDDKMFKLISELKLEKMEKKYGKAKKYKK